MKPRPFTPNKQENITLCIPIALTGLGTVFAFTPNSDGTLTVGGKQTIFGNWRIVEENTFTC